VMVCITDPLTGAYNRRHFDAQLAQLPPPAAGAAAVNVLLAVDLDHFKAVNDSLGHAVGDGVLQGAVAVLNARKRPSDRLFRTGGEEFMLLLPRITVADAARLADELRQLIEAAPLLAGQPVTVSIGVAAQRAGRDAKAWLLAADEALYEAKRSGRNRVVVAR
jgi:diguanylate cyclase (GGDEF)-like protein